MSADEYDVIVVGAGMAGLACAAELTILGLRPLLACETKEVGSTLRSCWVGGNRGIQQHPEYQVGWGGGWWYQLVRKMNIPVTLHNSLGLTALLIDDWREIDIPITPSASSLTEVICTIHPRMEGIRDTLERILHGGLMIPYTELCQMTQVSLQEWLVDQGADEEVVALVVSLMTNMLGLRMEDGPELSVFGGWGGLRTMMCGEGTFVVPVPDPRDGLAVPIARAIERDGGTVWRGKKVANILIEGGRATGVVMEDGTEARAGAIAVAVGNPRLAAIMDPLPPEVEVVMDYTRKFVLKEDLNVYTVLNKPVVKRDRLYIIVDSDGSNLQWMWPLHPFPWTLADPSKHFTVSFRALPPGGFDAQGGLDVVREDMFKLDERLWPGFIDAIEDYNILQHKHHWLAPQTIGPKLPRISPTCEGLYYVGEGSLPLGGFWVETAASTGILGARAIHQSLVPV
jgi:FAD binding domain